MPGSGRSTGEGISYPLQYSWASPVAQLVKNLPAMWETWVRSLGWEAPQEKGLSQERDTGKGWNQPRGMHRAEPMRDPKRYSLFSLWSRGQCVTSSQPQNAATCRAPVPSIHRVWVTCWPCHWPAIPSPSQRAANVFSLQLLWRQNCHSMTPNPHHKSHC